MPLFADVLVRRRAFTLETSLSVDDGETLALLGPNGSGKSTLLDAIAGLLAPERARIEVNGRTLTSVGESGVGSGRDGGEASARNKTVAPHERRVGLLGQDPLLFPHLSALENIAFGARARGEATARAREAAARWLDAVDLEGFGARLPSQLSGGQQQRVAIARALAATPDVLLLDEPMAALDVQNASAVRTLLRERLTATALPTIVVTHDVVDAMVLADRVAIMDDGRIVDIGEPAIVLGQPKNQFAATLVGLNLMHGTVGTDGAVHGPEGRVLQGVGVESRPLREGELVTAAFPPSAVRISTELAPGAAGSSWRATVGVLEPAVRGIRVPFVGEMLAAELSTAELLKLGLREGMAVTVSVDPSVITVYRQRNEGSVMAG